MTHAFYPEASDASQNQGKLQNFARTVRSKVEKHLNRSYGSKSPGVGHLDAWE